MYAPWMVGIPPVPPVTGLGLTGGQRSRLSVSSPESVRHHITNGYVDGMSLVEDASTFLYKQKVPSTFIQT